MAGGGFVSVAMGASVVTGVASLTANELAIGDTTPRPSMSVPFTGYGSAEMAGPSWAAFVVGRRL